MNDKRKAHLALLGANLIFGANYTIAKAVMPRLIHPLGFIFLRVVPAAALFWLFAISPKYRQPIDWKDWPRFLLCSLLGVAINQFLFFAGLSMTYPIHASLLSLTTPLVVMIFSAFLLKDRMTSKKIIGLILGITGAVLIITEGQQIAMNNNAARGDILVFMNAASYGCYLVVVKPLMEKYAALQVIRWVFTLGMIWVIPVGFHQFASIPWHLFHWKDWLSAGYVVIGTTFLAYMFNAYGVKILDPSTTGAYIYLQPFFAAIIALIFFGEKLTVVKLVAAALIFTGVYLVERGKYNPIKISYGKSSSAE
jgi:drug/metabolite transporter (DMT)-like permease